MMPVLYVLIGFAGGIVSGIFGVGGATILIPALVFIVGLTQHQAQGTSLAILLPPVGVLAVLRYYYAGHVKVQIALLAAAGFFLGALLGAHYVQGVADIPLRRAFGIFLLVVGARMIIGK